MYGPPNASNFGDRLGEIEHSVMQYKAQIGMQNYGQPAGGGMISKQHQDLAAMNERMMGMYHSLCAQHMDLLDKHTKATSQHFSNSTRAATGGAETKGKAKAACLGVIRLDYDYPPAPGDIDCPKSFGYDVFYRVVPGLTFEMCQSGKLTREVEKEFCEAIDWLVGKGVSGITGDCGFMMYFQALARQNTSIPVFMSALAQTPAVTCGFSQYELIGVMTANGASLRPMRNLIKDECGVDPEERRFIMVGCENVPGFEAVALGGKVNVAKVTPGVVELAKQTLIQHPKIRAWLFECTELPPYADAVRAATGLPVFDAITCCNFFISGRQDNDRFGINDWQADWDGVQDEYKYGQNLDAGDKSKLVNKCD